MRRLLMALLAAGVALSAAGCNLSAVTPTPAPRDAPTIRFQLPAPDATFREGEEVEILLVAQDEGAGVARVELLVDDLLHQQGEPVASAAVPVFTVTMNWLAQGIGLHAFSAIAFRADGTASDPAHLRILVAPSGSP
jgi:hypothetical protein